MKSLVTFGLLLVLPNISQAGSSCDAVPLQSGNFLVAEVQLDGQPAHLALDPIRNVLLDKAYAIDAGMQVLEASRVGYQGEVRIGGAGAEEQVPGFIIGLELVAGDTARELAPVIVVNLRGPLGEGFAEIDGLLGTDLFDSHVLDIDAPGNCMRLLPLEEFEPPPGAMAVSRMRHRPVVSGSLKFPNGETHVLHFLLDFGMSGGVRLSTRFVNEHGLAEKLETRVPRRMETGLGGELQSLEADADRLVIGDTTWEDVSVRLARETEGADADPPWDALLGIGLLKTRRMLYDPVGDRFWLLPASE